MNAEASSPAAPAAGYDYVIVNDDIEACFGKVTEILAAERMKRARQTGLIGFVRELMRD